MTDPRLPAAPAAIVSTVTSPTSITTTNRASFVIRTTAATATRARGVGSRARGIRPGTATITTSKFPLRIAVVVVERVARALGVGQDRQEGRRSGEGGNGEGGEAEAGALAQTATLGTQT